MTERHGRVSSAIEEFDMEQLIGTTRSGRKYKLVNKRISFGEMGDVGYTWEAWKRHAEVTEVKDVTEQFIPQVDENEDE